MNLLTLSELKRRVESLRSVAERRMSWVDVQSALGDLDGRLTAGLATDVAPPSGARPTRTEALEVGTEAWLRDLTAKSPQTRLGNAVDAVAALFGGFAPEPVEVPVVVIHRGRDGRMPVSWISTDAGEYGLRDEQQLAIAARSNAWEQLKTLAADLNGCLDGSASVITWPLAQRRAKELLDLVGDPRMGVGPKESR